MPQNYDEATRKFIDETAHEVLPTRDAYPRPVQPQSPDVAPGNNAAVYPQGGEEHKPSGNVGARTAIRATSKILGGGDPKAVITKALLSKGIAALAERSYEGGKTAGVEDDTPIRPLDIYNRLNELYRDHWHDWEPETILRTLEMDTGITIGPDGTNLLGALQTVVQTNQAHEHWQIFEKVGHALNLNHVDFSTVQPLRPDEAALAIAILNKLRKQESFDREVVHYVAACGKHSGMVWLPDTFFQTNNTSITPQMSLDTMGNDEHLREAVKKRWEANEFSSPVVAEDIQLKGLKEIEDYLRSRL